MLDFLTVLPIICSSQLLFRPIPSVFLVFVVLGVFSPVFLSALIKADNPQDDDKVPNTPSQVGANPEV